MLEETEMKLCLSSETMALLIKHPLITDRMEGHWNTVNLTNQYFDTLSFSLDQADVALRLRLDGEQVIQTLKGRGDCIAGLFVRNEWDWYLDSYELNLELLDSNCWPEALIELDKTTIEPVFINQFTRTKAILKWLWKGQTVEVEVAFDVGSVVTDVSQDSISELELEMRQGPIDALMDFVVELSSCFSLIPSSISKGERGYRLLKEAPENSLKNSMITQNNLTIDEEICSTGKILLRSLQHLIESIYTVRKVGTLKQVQQQLVLLRSFFACLDCRIVSEDQKQFQLLLDTVTTDIETLLKPSLSATQLESEFQRYIAKTTWGFLCLRLAKWCMLKEWQLVEDIKQREVLDTSFKKWLKKAELQLYVAF
ncbi:MAG: hypothetical protein COA59_12565 [Colwellia sp.]|nr:MAG: hypothetical protein COA59_12565 [Colwellia sp.]